MDKDTLDSINKKLSAILALLVKSAEDKDSDFKSEFLLESLGLDRSEMVKITGKTKDAIRMSLKRSGKKS